MGDVTWAAVGVLVPIIVSGFALLWQMGDRHHRDLVELRTELRGEIAEIRSVILRHFGDHTR